MVEAAALRAVEHIVPYDPRAQGEPLYYGCMDKRSFMPDDLAAMGGHYRQYASGPDGFGRDVATTLEVMRPNSFVKHGRPVHVLGGIVAGSLGAEGIITYLHDNCAGEGFAPEINNVIATHPDATLRRAQEIHPDVAEQDVENIREALLRQQKSGLLHAPEQVANDYKNGYRQGAAGFAPVKRLAVVEGGPTRNVLINDEPRTAFVPAKAMAADAGAYHISFGDLPEIVDVISETIPLDLDIFNRVAAVRHGAAVLALEQLQGQRFNIHRVSDLRRIA